MNKNLMDKEGKIILPCEAEMNWNQNNLLVIKERRKYFSVPREEKELNDKERQYNHTE